MSTFLQPIDGYPATSLLLFLQSAPPPIIFVAFQADCNARGIQWYSTEGQLFAISLFLKHPVSHRYPPRMSTLRSFLKQYISLIEQPHIMTKVMETNGGLEDPIQVELMEALIGLNMSRNDAEATTCFKSFFNPYLERNIRRASSTALSVSNSDVDSAAPMSKRERERLRRERREVMSMFCPIRVSSEQFRNVGLSLWPAAFVLVQLLAQEMKGITHLLTEHLFPDRVDWDVASDSSSSEHDDDALLVEGLDDDDEDPESGSGPYRQRGRSPGHRRDDGAGTRGKGPIPRDHSGHAPHSVSAETSAGSLPRPQEGVSLLARKSSSPLAPAATAASAKPTASPANAVPEAAKLHFLELGAGVGLTPVLLHRLRSYRAYVANFTVTDYQANLTDNIAFNLKNNKVTTVSDYEAAARGLEGSDKAPPYHLVSLLDWNDDALTQQSQLLNWQSDVVLAADCIYDVDVIPGLVRTIHTALTMRYSGKAPAQGESSPQKDSAVSQAPPQKRLSRHLGSNASKGRSRAAGMGTGSSQALAPYDPLLSSPESANNSFALGTSYDWGVDFMPAPTARPPRESTRSPLLRSPTERNDMAHSPPADAPRSVRNLAQAAASPKDTTTPSASPPNSHAAGPASAPSKKKRVCIVVQTHRQASTMKVFFDAVREFANVESYVLERMPVLNLESQLSKGRDCKDGGVVPIGDYNPNQSHAVFERRDQWVCALRPDVVLPDGSLQSVVSKAAAERTETRTGAHGLAKGPSDTVSWSGSVASTPSSALGGGGFTGSATASWSAVSSFSTFTAADVDALLKDEMIGPFFTSMAGLIGVHVITLKN